MRALFLFCIILLGLVILLVLLPIRVCADGAFALNGMRLTFCVSILHGMIRKSWTMPPFPRLQKQKGRVGFKAAKSVFRLLQQVLARVRFWQCDLYVCLGTGNAAQTALLCGTLRAALSGLVCALLPRGRHGVGWRAQFWPNFDAPDLRGQMTCIISFRLVQIIGAAIVWRIAQKKESRT